MDEKQLVEKCRQGDNAALKELYGILSPRMMAICRRYASDSTKADDIFQDGFIDILDGLDKFTWRGEGFLSAWASKVMTNRALMSLRGKTTGITLESLEMTEEPAPEDILKVPPAILRQYISELPEGYRSVFILHVFDGMSHKDVARQLGIKERSCSSQFYRARKLLAKRINEYLRKNDEPGK